MGLTEVKVNNQKRTSRYVGQLSNWVDCQEPSRARVDGFGWSLFALGVG